MSSLLSRGLLDGGLLRSSLGGLLGLLDLTLHSLAGLAEDTAQLVTLGLGLAVGALVVGVALLLAEVTEEGSAAAVLGSLRSSRRSGRGGVLGSFSVSSSSYSLGLNGLDVSLLDGVVELRSTAGNGGLNGSGSGSGSGSLLLRLLVRGAGDLLEEIAEKRSALGLLGNRSLGLLLLFLLLLLVADLSRSGCGGSGGFRTVSQK